MILSILTVAALVAFAANSLLCRLALGAGRIDAATFTTVRLVSGTVTLFAILALTQRERFRTARVRRAGANAWLAGALLFLYAAPFSFAYLDLSAGTGALLLFGAVQATMIAAGLVSGERPRPREWLGLLLAIAGLVMLVLPGLTAPAPFAAALMLGAGVAWGRYSLLGRGAPDPLFETARNFALASIPALALSAFALVIGSPFGAGSTLETGPVTALRPHVTAQGIGLAIASGAVASGLGYVAWYAALRSLSATRAATLQLAVPVLAATGGVLFLGERVGWRLVASAVLILGGVALAVTVPARRS
ncbi:MAG: DMT family transporter [Candidatus Eiseniibacteriota bacterium]